jgi:hypothetical protein
MKKLRIVKKSWPDGTVFFEIQECGWFNKWKPVKSYTYSLGYKLSHEKEYESLEAAQKDLWRFDGTKYPKVEIIQTNEL